MDSVQVDKLVHIVFYLNMKGGQVVCVMYFMLTVVAIMNDTSGITTYWYTTDYIL